MIKELSKIEIKQALNLVNTVFSEFVAADYSEQGNKTFDDYLKVKYDEVVNDVQTVHKRIWGYYLNNEVVCVIATRDISHIALMFVDKKYHRRGIAKQLYNTVLTGIKSCSKHKSGLSAGKRYLLQDRNKLIVLLSKKTWMRNSAKMPQNNVC